MKNIIDSLIIGYNEVNFIDYENTVKMMGTHTATYRFNSLNFIQYKNKPCSVSDIFNEFYYRNRQHNDDNGPLGLSNMFSNTIAYLVTFLNKHGITTDFVNSFNDEKEEIIERLLNNKVLTVVIPTTLYLTSFPILEIISFVRKYNIFAKIIVGGPFIYSQLTALDDTTIQYLLKSINADVYINSHQGEVALTNVIKSVKNQTSFNEVHNIYYKNQSKYYKTETYREDNHLEDNIIDWRIFGTRLKKFAMVRTTTSCPFSCSYCEFPQRAGKYTTLNVPELEKELDSIESMKSVESVSFIDDTFNVPPKRFKEILGMMINNKYSFKWHSFIRCQYLDEEAVALMKESGCEVVYLGIESGNDTMLKNMNKHSTVEKYENGLKLLKKYGIITVASFMVGFPGETEETVKDTIRFIQENKPDFIRIHLWYCSPLTPIWQKRDEYGIEGSQMEWTHKTMDCNTASDYIDEIILNLKSSIFLPLHEFDSIGIVNLLHRGLSIEQIKEFLGAFNDGLCLKINNSLNPEISPQIVKKIKLALGV